MAVVVYPIVNPLMVKNMVCIIQIKTTAIQKMSSTT